MKVFNGSDRVNQRSLILQNVINAPGCLEIYETNAINQFAGTTGANVFYSSFVIGTTSRTSVVVQPYRTTVGGAGEAHS